MGATALRGTAGIRQVRVSSAADWFVSQHAARTIGVTGTKGKSTTASFLGHLLNSLGVDAVVAGNIGTPLSDLAPDGDAVVVAELSSQQAALLSMSPAVAVVTNLYEDHLDWHGDTGVVLPGEGQRLPQRCADAGDHAGDARHASNGSESRRSRSLLLVDPETSIRGRRGTR